jgi:hypothetical protein
MRLALFLSAITLLQSQSSSPRSHASDYPVHVQLDSVSLGAEYLVHSLPTESGTLVANEYLVVEVAFFGPNMSRLKMSPDQFSLRINGRGTPLPTEPAGLVARSIKFPGEHPGLTAAAGVQIGDGSVTVGPRPPPSQFPGDGNERTPQGTATVKEINDEATVEARIQAACLPEGERSLPRSGLLYFPYRGKTKNIRSVELFYDGTMGQATLKLLP